MAVAAPSFCNCHGSVFTSCTGQKPLISIILRADPSQVDVMAVAAPDLHHCHVFT